MLTAGKLVRIVVGAVGDADPVHCRHDLRLSVAAGPFAVDDTQFDVLLDRQLVDQVEALEDEAEIVAAQLRQFRFRELGDLTITEQVLTAGGAVDGSQDIQQRGLAAAGRTHDGDEFSLTHVKLDGFQCGGFDLVGPIEPVNIGKRDHGVSFRSKISRWYFSKPL